MSTVIKKGQTARLVHRLVSLDLADHLAEADKVVASARRQARQTIESAKAEGDRICKQAREDGHREGVQLGQAEGRREGNAQALAEAGERFSREQTKLVGALEQALKGIEDRKRELLIQAERDLLVFAVQLAKKVTQGVGQLDSGVAQANVEMALRLVGRCSDVAVCIHPQDAAALRQFAAELSEQVDRSAHLSIVEDESIGPGGAVIRAGAMEIDARLETQLEQLTAVLLGQD